MENVQLILHIFPPSIPQIYIIHLLMNSYRSQSNKTSGVIAFEIRTDAILVQFHDHTYLYTYKSAGKAAIERMKKYALAQKGLSTYISQHQPAYEMKY